MEKLIEEPAISYGNRCSLEEFIKIEYNDVRYEYWDGELLPMAAVSLSHNDIVFNINASFRKELKNKGCRAFQENVFLKLKQFNKVFLPDVMVSCNQDEFVPGNNFLETPIILVEVLSDSTELYDRTKKWEIYRRIPSLRYYLLVSQHEYHIDMYQRPNDQSLFYFQSFEGIESTIDFSDFGFKISLGDIYEGIQINEKETHQTTTN